MEIALPQRSVGGPGLPPDIADLGENAGRGPASAQ
jgi:hypothetical protein